jgi:hypothetical protein
MYGLEEINLDPGKSVPAGRSVDAEARAKAFAAGCRWQCKRVKAWVNAEECVARYIAAKGSQQAYCACLECGSVRTQLKGMAKQLEGVSHVQHGRGGPVASAPRPATYTSGTETPARLSATRPISEPTHRPAPMPKEKITDIVSKQKEKVQGEKAMSRPAKKRAEDPVMSEVKAAAAPVREVVKPEPPAAKPETFDPFASWEKYDTLLGRKQRKLAFVRMTHKAIYFSTRCVENLRLSDYATLDVLVAPDLSGLAFRFHKDDAGTFTLSKRIKDKTELKISAAGLVRFYEGLQPHLEKKLEPIVHGPGRISILFAKEVEA